MINSLDDNASFLNELGKHWKEKLYVIRNLGDSIIKDEKDNKKDSFNKSLINISFNYISNK